MNHSRVWLDHFITIGNAACEGVLHARAAKREARRAARDEAAVPPHWRARPPTQDAPTVSAPQAPPRESPPASPQPAVVPLVLPRVVAPWERPPRTRAAQPSSTAPAAPVHSSPVVPATHTEPMTTACPTPATPVSAPTATPVAPAPAPPATSSQKLDRNDQAPEPPATHQLELDFTAKPAPPQAAEPAQSSTPSTPPKSDEAEHAAAAGRLATLLGQVVGDIVSDTLEIVLDRQEQRFVQMLDHQDIRFEEMLDRQAKSHAADMTWIAEMNAENLRTILREVITERSPAPVTPPAEAPQAMTATIVEVVEDLQETLRLGFGEIRAGLTRHHNELMAVVRSEIRPLAQAALARLIRDAQEPASVPQGVLDRSPPTVGAVPRPDRERSPTSDVAPARTPATQPGPPDAPERAPIASSPLVASAPPLTPTQWQHVHAALGDDDGDDDDSAPDDDARPPLRYVPPDDILAHAAEASP